jgi:hypothetical protein
VLGPGRRAIIAANGSSLNSPTRARAFRGDPGAVRVQKRSLGGAHGSVPVPVAAILVTLDDPAGDLPQLHIRML